MQRISIPWIVGVIAAVDDLKALKAGSVMDHWDAVFNVMNQLEAVFNQSLYAGSLRASLQSANELYATVKALTEPFDLARVMTPIEAYNLDSQRTAFRLVFMAELSALPSYFVTQKDGGFNTETLLANGVGLFPSTLLGKAPETQRDAIEMGKALAFDLPTAAGFHAWRVAEAVLRRYWDEVTEGKDRPHPQTLGNIAGQLRILDKGDQGLVTTIIEVTKLHRNPLAHRTILDYPEAVGIVGMANSIIAPMLNALPDAKLTPDTPVTA